MQNKKSMIDCVNLIENELGYENLPAAIKFVDDNLGDSWVKHLSELELKMNDLKYLVSSEYRLSLSDWHFNTIREFIKFYKRHSKRVDSSAIPLFDDFHENIISKSKGPEISSSS